MRVCAPYRIAIRSDSTIRPQGPTSFRNGAFVPPLMPHCRPSRHSCGRRPSPASAWHIRINGHYAVDSSAAVDLHDASTSGLENRAGRAERGCPHRPPASSSGSTKRISDAPLPNAERVREVPSPRRQASVGHAVKFVTSRTTSTPRRPLQAAEGDPDLATRMGACREMS